MELTRKDIVQSLSVRQKRDPAVIRAEIFNIFPNVAFHLGASASETENVDFMVKLTAGLMPFSWK